MGKANKRHARKALAKETAEQIEKHFGEQSRNDAMSKEDVSKKTDEQLFVVDKAKDVESYKQVRNARPLEMPDSAKELFWQSALVPKDGLPPLSKVTKVPHGAHRGDRLALERAKQRLENSQTEPKRSRKRQRVDIWDIEQPKITPNESILAPKVIPKRKKTAGLKPVVEDMPAVRVPSEGLSYNPRDEAHQEALAVAAAQLRKRDLEYEDAIEKMNPKGVTGEGLIVSVGGPDDSADEQDDDAQKLVKRARLSQDRLSTAQRNRRERHRVLMRMIQQQKRDKMILKQLDQLPNISREVKTFEEQAQTKMERRAALLRERRRRTPFVGKLRVSDYTEVLEVPRTAELSGSLRTMKAKGNVLKDRYKSFLQRGIIEKRTHHKIRRAQKLKYYNKEKGTVLSQTPIADPKPKKAKK